MSIQKALKASLPCVVGQDILYLQVIKTVQTHQYLFWRLFALDVALDVFELTMTLSIQDDSSQLPMHIYSSKNSFSASQGNRV